MISELRAHFTRYFKSRPPISSTVITSTSSRQKSPQKIKKIQPTRPLQPSTQPNHHATRNLSPLFAQKKASEHPRIQHRISVPANIGRRQLVGLKPGPLQPGASTKGGDGGISWCKTLVALSRYKALRCDAVLVFGQRCLVGGGGGGVRIAARQPFVRRRDRQEEVGLGAKGLGVYIISSISCRLEQYLFLPY